MLARGLQGSQKGYLCCESLTNQCDRLKYSKSILKEQIELGKTG